MNRQIIQYKITFTGPGNEVEIRYLVMETISYHSYLYFVRKLIALFPILKDVPFSVNWKDKEGDIVRICSDDELTIALDEMKSDPVKKIFIIVKEQENEKMLHSDIVCNGCDHPIKGFRYKCLICDDYELCSDCERLQTHPDHPMIRVPKPLSPDKPYGKQFLKEIPKITQRLMHLFQQTEGNVGSSTNDQKSSSVYDLKQPFKICHNKLHNIAGERLIKTLIMHKMDTLKNKSQQEDNSSQNEPSSTEACSGNELQNVNVLTDQLRSLSIDVNSGATRRETGSSEDKPTQDMDRDERLTSISGVNMYPTEALQAMANPANQPMSQIDAAPTPADPTPVLQAQLTPPTSSVNIVPTPTVLTASNNTVAPPSPPTANPPVPLSTLLASAPVETSLDAACSNENSNKFPAYLIPPPIEDDGYLDNSWSVVESVKTDISSHSSNSIDTIESPETTPISTPQLTESPPAKEMGLYEETIRMLYTLGFEKKEWLNLVVESKEGDIREVLKFLSPIKKPSTNLQ